jgi:hypothetical protein
VSGLERMFMTYPPLNQLIAYPSLRAQRSNPESQRKTGLLRH